MLDDAKRMSYITAGDQISFDLSRLDVEAALIVGQGHDSHDAEMSCGPEGIVSPVMGENHEDGDGCTGPNVCTPPAHRESPVICLHVFLLYL